MSSGNITPAAHQRVPWQQAHAHSIMVNILLCLLIVRKRRRSSLEGQTNKDYTCPTSYQSANLMSLSSYDPYQTQVSDDDEYQYDEQKGVDGVQTFTGEETREDAENKND